MSDPNAAEPAPIVVRDSPAAEAGAQTLRVVLLGAFAAAADHFVHSQMAMGAVLAGAAALAGFVATYLFGLRRLMVQHGRLKALAQAAPDALAVVR